MYIYIIVEFFQKCNLETAVWAHSVGLSPRVPTPWKPNIGHNMGVANIKGFCSGIVKFSQAGAKIAKTNYFSTLSGAQATPFLGGWPEGS